MSSPTRVNGEIPTSFGGVEIVPISQAESIGTCMAIYGGGGVGKTTIIGKVAEHYGPLLYIDAEGGGVSIRHLPNVHLAQVNRWSQIENLRRQCERDSTPFRAIALDNMSEMQNLCLTSIVTDMKPQIQHWGECTAKMLKLTRDFREISRTQGVHVFFIAWESPETTESGVVIKRGVGFTPSLARQFPGIVNFVGHMSAVDGHPTVRKLSFTVSSKTDAKFRVSPGDTAAKIPLELFIPEDSNVLADFIGSAFHSKPFPRQRYEAPTRKGT